MAALLRPSVAGAVFNGESSYALSKVASNLRMLYTCCSWSVGNIFVSHLLPCRDSKCLLWFFSSVIIL